MKGYIELSFVSGGHHRITFVNSVSGKGKVIGYLKNDYFLFSGMGRLSESNILSVSLLMAVAEAVMKIKEDAKFSGKVEVK